MEDKENIEYFEFGKDVSVSLGTEAQVEIEGVEFRAKSIFVGMDPDKEYLIMKFPYIEGGTSLIQHKLYEGNNVLIRYLHRGSVFGFQSKLLGTITTPRKLMFISYPKIIEEHNIRSEKRVSCYLPARIKTDDGENKGYVRDINRGGCQCVIKHSEVDRLKNFFKIDGEIGLTFLLPGVEGDQSLTGTIKNIERNRKEINIGVEFGEIKEDVKSKISEFCSSSES